ncbi:hypothetical protein F5146DRAFT_715573 [Armillaria mellea]|nr:hypothetical protein F5146DRAFT_715573 [Armillaria mellea]
MHVFLVFSLVGHSALAPAMSSSGERKSMYFSPGYDSYGTVSKRSSSGFCEVCCSLSEVCVFCIYLTGSLSLFFPSDGLPHGSVFTQMLRFLNMIIEVPSEA